MPSEESKLSIDWFRIGDEDLKASEILLREDSLKISAFHLQQAIEKYLKGYLLSQGWKLIRTHDLEQLLDYVGKYTSDFESFRKSCSVVTEYYIDEPYPIFQENDLTYTEIESRISKIKELINKIRSSVK
jgi:HEPN domain-containing protein